jgi:hypothetical protein
MLYALFRRWKDENKRRDFRSAQVTAAVYNTIPTKNGKVWSPDDFMPNYDPPPKPMTVQQTVDYVATLNRLFGGEDLRALPSG